MEKKDFTDAVRDKIGREPPFGLKKAFLAGPMSCLGTPRQKKKSRVCTLGQVTLGSQLSPGPRGRWSRTGGGGPRGPPPRPAGAGWGRAPRRAWTGRSSPGRAGRAPARARGGGPGEAMPQKSRCWTGEEPSSGAGPGAPPAGAPSAPGNRHGAPIRPAPRRPRRRRPGAAEGGTPQRRRTPPPGGGESSGSKGTEAGKREARVGASGAEADGLGGTLSDPPRPPHPRLGRPAGQSRGRRSGRRSR